MNKKIMTRMFSLLLCGVVAVPAFTSCGSKKKKDSIVIMTEEVDGLFNPFYATSGADMDVIGMTQIGMLSTDSKGTPVAGDDLPTVVKAFDQGVYDSNKDETVYTFVLKNNLKFSDGHPLTMEDVLFNMYEYLDPVYTGSSTMYSIDIKGLARYRTQKTDEGLDDVISENASNIAWYRKQELITLYEEVARVGDGNSQTYSITEAEMKAAIDNYIVSDDYRDAVATEAQQATWTDKDYSNELKKDYEFALDTFYEELESDFRAAKESYDLKTPPYDKWAKELSSDIFKFFLYEGYITPKYAKLPNSSRDDKTKIESFENTQIVNNYKTEKEAIERVYKDNISSSLNTVLSYWGTAGTLLTEYTADATSILLRNNMEGDQLEFPNIEGIESLGHNTDEKSVTIGGQTYTVAHSHDENGKPTNANEYDVLRITINGKDPKAILSFAFTVAPSHYYTADEQHPNGRKIDIENNQFGVEWASNDFQGTVIKSKKHVEVPVGAGPFVATNANNKDNPSGTEFWSNNVVYFKRNENFMFEVKAEKLRLQVVSSANALNKLENGEVDYITPQFTLDNAEQLSRMSKKGFVQLDAWQLGYGYIGINAGKVKNINVRRAIMSAMQTSLALEFYQPGTCKTIDWPMSMESWAYPFDDDGKSSKPNKWDYTQWTDPNGSYTNAKAKIQRYMDAAGVAEGDPQLKVRFTIAGANISEHPTYEVFKQAAELLNEMGWDVEVKADSKALTKLSTGSLEVWAAAWGSSIDPDMYQVYHKDSKATSVNAWGYREIKSGGSSQYPEEMRIINQLSAVIDDARAVMTREERTPLYEQAMNLVLELAVELPVYQRMTLYAYNSKTIKGLPAQEEVDSYNSPLGEIWKLELV